MIQSDILGAKEIENALKELPNKIAGSILFKSLRAGANVIKKEMQVRVPKRTGALAKSIMIARDSKATKRKGSATVVIGFRRPVSRRAHLTEYGTRNSSAQPFVRPALDGKGNAAIKAIGERMGAEIDKEAEKLGRASRGLKF